MSITRQKRMDKDMEKYLGNVCLPEYETSQHRQELRQELIKEIERRRQMAPRRKVLRVVYILAALVCVSAIAIAGATYRKWIFRGEEDGTYTFTPEPEKGQRDSESVAVMSSDPNFTMSPSEIEQTRRDIEEMDALQQEGKRELVKILETELDGEAARTYIYKYVLSDGREKTVGANNPDNPEEEIPQKILSLDRREISILLREGKGELLEPEEEEISGKVFVFERYRLKLSDGNEIIRSIGVPKKHGE